jgi:alanine dehydrogenase
MSEVAGRLAIEAAGAGLRKYAGGRGIVLGGVPGVVPARIAIIGGGVVGTHAARMAAGLGSDITVFDISIPQLRRLDEIFQGRIRTLSDQRGCRTGAGSGRRRNRGGSRAGRSCTDADFAR